MALLNFASNYQDVVKYKNLTANSPSLSGSNENDYVKLVFTKDGHIITHGVDYIPSVWDISKVQKQITNICGIQQLLTRKLMIVM